MGNGPSDFITIFSALVTDFQNGGSHSLNYSQKTNTPINRNEEIDVTRRYGERIKRSHAVPCPLFAFLMGI